MRGATIRGYQTEKKNILRRQEKKKFCGPNIIFHPTITKQETLF